jgi:hypothetical protein
MPPVDCLYSCQDSAQRQEWVASRAARAHLGNPSKRSPTSVRVCIGEARERHASSSSGLSSRISAQPSTVWVCATCVRATTNLIVARISTSAAQARPPMHQYSGSLTEGPEGPETHVPRSPGASGASGIRKTPKHYVELRSSVQLRSERRVLEATFDYVAPATDPVVAVAMPRAGPRSPVL